MASTFLYYYLIAVSYTHLDVYKRQPIEKLKQEVHQKCSMRNVLGMIPGKNTKDYVIEGAHFDQLGSDPALDGDQIYNGADDNASGCLLYTSIGYIRYRRSGLSVWSCIGSGGQHNGRK